MQVGEAQREGDIESEAGSRLQAVSTEPDVGLQLTTCEIVTWAKVRPLTGWATQAPLCLFTLKDSVRTHTHTHTHTHTCEWGRSRRRGRERILSRLRTQHEELSPRTHNGEIHDMSQNQEWMINWAIHAPRLCPFYAPVYAHMVDTLAFSLFITNSENLIEKLCISPTSSVSSRLHFK